MEFQQFYLNCLAHASYLVGSAGCCAIVDPQRDVDIYLQEASRRKLKITHIIETHLHADFVSGHVELARRTGADILIGARACARFPHIAVRDGDEVRFGKVVLKFLETPGHTVESICVLVTDESKGANPMALLSGDTLFIGDVGRPDLSPEHSPMELAGMLYMSLHEKILPLADDTLVYPAHGAGSLCGRSMSSELSSTIGVQRRSNYALLAPSREVFIRLLTEDLPERPGYFARDAEINREGPGPLYDIPPLLSLKPFPVRTLQEEGVIVLDTRPAHQYLASHIPGSLHLGLGGQFAAWAGALLGLEREIVLVAEDPNRIEESCVRLARVGIEKLRGALGGGLPSWEKAGLPLRSIVGWTAEELHARQQAWTAPVILDVRMKTEYEVGHIPGAFLIPLGELARRTDELDPAAPHVVSCQGGYRSAIACSLLERAGFNNITNLTGGFNAWSTMKLPAAQ